MPRHVTFLDQAAELDLFEPHTAFTVHCSHCGARLDAMGNCPACGLIGHSREQVEARAKADPDGVAKLVARAIEKRKAFVPARKGEKSLQR